MPHSWSRLSDTHFELLHFTKHRHGKGERKRELGEAGANKHQGKQHGGKIAGKEHIGKDHSNPVASAVGKLAEVRSTQRASPLAFPLQHPAHSSGAGAAGSLLCRGAVPDALVGVHLGGSVCVSGVRRHRLLMTRMLHSQAAMKGGRKHHGHHRDPHKGIPNVLVAHMEVRADPPRPSPLLKKPCSR